MQYVGLDVHQCRSSMCILDDNGKIVKREQILGRWPKVIERVRQIQEPFSLCYEASCGYGYLYDRLRPLASHVAVAHPGALRWIFRSKRKFDRIDAEKLAKLLYLGEVPQVHVPDVNVRSWRKLIELRQHLLRRGVALKNQIRAVLRGQAIAAPRWLWARKHRPWLENLQLPVGEKLTLEIALMELDQLAGKIKRVEKELAKISDKHPGIRLLMTIPGVGIRTAEAFCAYVDQIARFARTCQVGTYFGLVPCQDSSAGKERLGHITKDGPPTVRKLLCEASWIGIRHDPTLRELFERISKGDPDRKKIALVAVANHLCRAMAAMLRTGEAWRGSLKQDGLRPAA